MPAAPANSITPNRRPGSSSSNIYHSSRAAGQIGVAKKTLEPHPVALPCLAEQNAVVETIQKLETETQRPARLYERKLAALEALKKSLLHRAFTGEL